MVAGLFSQLNIMYFEKTIKVDYLIIGSGIIGLALAKNLRDRYQDKSIAIIEKEKDVAYHSSGRNSGVLHAGFYYTKDSLKAKFSKEGNKALREYCEDNNLKINKCGKVVVVSNEEELETLYELKKRGDINQVELKLIDEKELEYYEPNAKTYKKALWSPTTATVDPLEVSKTIKNELMQQDVKFYFETPYKERLDDNTISAGANIFEAGKIINAAGLYADKIASDFGYSKDYIIIPFKGIYLEYTGNDKPVKTNIYPVPNLKNPFLGVHFTIKADGKIKIGPTAIPVLWRENYKGFERFKIDEAVQILSWETKLFLTNAFGFKSLALEEIKKMNKRNLIKLAEKMIKKIDSKYFDNWGKPGIRAQLLNTKTMELVQDFVVEGNNDSIHILNAVSPAFTCSLPFTNWIIENFIEKQ